MIFLILLVLYLHPYLTYYGYVFFTSKPSFHIYPKYWDTLSALQTVYTLIRCHILWHQIWVYTVCKDLPVPILKVILIMYCFDGTDTYGFDMSLNLSLSLSSLTASNESIGVQGKPLPTG